MNNRRTVLLSAEETEKVRQNGPIQPLQRTPVPKPRAPEQPKKESEVPPPPVAVSPAAETNSAADKEDAEEMTTLAGMQNQHGSFLCGPSFSFSSLV